MVMVLP